MKAVLRTLQRYITRLWRREAPQSPPRHPPVGLVRFGSLTPTAAHRPYLRLGVGPVHRPLLHRVVPGTLCR